MKNSSSSSDEKIKSKRKRDEEDDISKERKKYKSSKKKNVTDTIPRLSPSPAYLANILMQSKLKLQGKKKQNGITFALIGSSGAGKSTLLDVIFLNDIYGKRADKNYIKVVFTESPHCDAFQDLGTDVCIDGCGVDLDLINWFYQMNLKYDRIYDFVIILDDCIHLRYQKQIEKMFLVMRNTNISSVVSLQYCNLIPKSIRTSVYFIFCMHLNTTEAVAMMIDSFISMYIPGKTRNAKMEYYVKWTENHQFFMIDNLSHQCWKVDKNFMCEEMMKQPMCDDPLAFSEEKKKDKDEEYDSFEFNESV